ncbi:branched-chain amino acid ABC transporter permease [Noviherbaspirillum cavernae]|uniref:Branched-chain amino acid ABC transporter permease n=1 Tax=Noviherbaspirillum cavernae TaxID=2320862 RepID=A0A418WVS6_9BURK|nr:branched-chain amino acid ABC transporter permease [Noviherbaspirillum cavernae]RJF96805.1 branched-chain amino acid ABC transporter permease [Noviherbaspirillum cavernae]
MKNYLPIGACLAAGLAAILILPLFLETFTLMELTVYVIMSILALSLGFIWGYGGILCFGQAAFFGLGSYAYAIAAINFGESTGAFAVAIVVPALFALALGYFIFFGRISDVYLGVITLTVTLILFNLTNSTSGDQYRIGTAAIGGFNGIPSIPTLNVPGSPDHIISPDAFFVVCVGFLMAAYIGLRLLLGSHFGRVLVALRENEQRVDLLGYDSRKYKLAAFVIGGGVAGLSGCLFANWGAFTSPTVFSLTQSALVIIWVLVGGVGTLLGPIIGCFFVQWLTSYIGGLDIVNPNLLLGAVLIGFVLLLPKGLVSVLAKWGTILTSHFGSKSANHGRKHSSPQPASGGVAQ